MVCAHTTLLRIIVVSAGTCELGFKLGVLYQSAPGKGQARAEAGDDMSEGLAGPSPER